MKRKPTAEQRPVRTADVIGTPEKEDTRPIHERLLTPELWNGITQEIEECRFSEMQDDWIAFMTLASKMAIAYPERRGELNPEKLWTDFKYELKLIKQNPGTWMILAREALTLCPEHRDELELDSDFVFNYFQRELEESRDDVERHVELCFEARQLLPTRYKDLDIQQFSEEDYRSTFADYTELNDWVRGSYQFADIAVKEARKV